MSLRLGHGPRLGPAFLSIDPWLRLALRLRLRLRLRLKLLLRLRLRTNFRLRRGPRLQSVPSAFPRLRFGLGLLGIDLRLCLDLRLRLSLKSVLRPGLGLRLRHGLARQVRLGLKSVLRPGLGLRLQLGLRLLRLGLELRSRPGLGRRLRLGLKLVPRLRPDFLRLRRLGQRRVLEHLRRDRRRHQRRVGGIGVRPRRLQSLRVPRQRAVLRTGPASQQPATPQQTGQPEQTPKHRHDGPPFPRSPGG
ncbi:hypothetical protein [Amycolatopsis sp. NPDC051061]|uniref:hypothetical protein n=1 Tax=Amycolatopsis sp. NPDC051061 TaxID=3155042 RepID=UPI003444CAF2